MVLLKILYTAPLELLIGLAAVLTLLEWATIMLGRRFALGPSITERSSHTRFTPTCGGFIWMLTGIIAIALFGDLSLARTWIFMGGIAVLGIISLIDDLHPLPPIPRLISQFIVMALSFKQLFYPQAFDIYMVILFCGVGIINAINFLDGICGMLALYGIVVTGSLIYALNIVGGADLQWYVPVLTSVMVAQLVFACFNLRDVIFAGDVGAITLGYIQVFVTIMLILFTRDASYMIFFIVCIFDTGLTTLQRLFLGKSILQPHRMNIYQLLSSEHKVPHVVVSLIYALLQLLIDALFFLIPVAMHWTFFLIVSGLLTVTYFVLRFSFRRQRFNED